LNDRKEVAMDRDDAGMSDRSDEAQQGDTGMIGSESEEPGPGRDTSLTDPDPVAASTDDRPGYESERSAADPGLAAEPVVDQGAYGAAGYEGEPGGAGMAGSVEEPEGDVPATYTGEEADVSGRPEYAERTEGGDQPLYQEETQRMDRPGGGGSLFTDEEPERLDRPGPQEPGVQDGVFDQESDKARRPSDGV
jgi:hypothetical protein